MTHSTPIRPVRRIAALALAVALGATGAIVGVALPAQAATTYTITGTVTGHTATGTAPLAGASVSIYQYPYVGGSGVYATTNSSGKYSVTVPTARKYAAYFTASGYATEWSGNTVDSSATTAITVSATAPTATRNMTMAKSSTVSGRIVDEKGQPVKGS